MINSRNSDVHLSKDMVLSKIREIDIFSYYCTPFKELGSPFCSDLREDNSPSVSIILWKGRLLYKDFGHPDHTFDCFSYICCKYNCNFFEALRIIDNDFGLKLGSVNSAAAFTKGYMALRSSKTVKVKRAISIRKKSRPWMKKDAEFWSKYLISKKTLCTFGVSPISHYWINEHRFSCELTYAYKIGNKYKIYSPYEEIKWISNTTKKHVQGFAQLPERGDLCIITSSLKDVMCLFEMGISAVALQSEMQMPGEAFIKMVQSRFKKVALFYDNDFNNPNNPGQSMASKICKEFYPLPNIYLPEDYGCKDLSDYIAKFRSAEGLKTIIQLQI